MIKQKKGVGAGSHSPIVFSLTAGDAMAPAGIMNGLVMVRDDLWAPNEVLARFGFPPASQDLDRLPELEAGGRGSLGLPRLTAGEADHRIRSATLRENPLMAPDTTCPAGLVRQPVVRPGLQGSSPQPFLPA